MEVTALIKQYFGSSNADVTVDVFDGKNIYAVYQRIVSMLTQHDSDTHRLRVLVADELW